MTAIKGLCLVTVEGKGMMGVPGIAARTFGAVAGEQISVLLITPGLVGAIYLLFYPGTLR